MKQWIKRTAVGLLATAILTGSAGAADFTHCADALRDMGLFQGSSKGYELDRAPTRAEAAVMLVRLLGKEDTAMRGSYQTPFTDVPKWAAPYVGWLYENNLTVGMSTKEFGTTQQCNAQQYATFLLRTLGYADGDGYTYQTALPYAAEKGILTAINTNKFLRDDMAAMSYAALNCPTRAGANHLLSELTAGGSVDSRKSAQTMQLFEAVRTYQERRAQTPRSYALTATVTDPTYQTASLTGFVTTDGNALSAELRQAETLVVGLYQKNGILHQYINGKTTQAAQPIALHTAAELPVIAIASASIREGVDAFSFVPSVLNRMSSGIRIAQADYSAKTQGGALGRQTVRLHADLPVNGRTARYIIELTASPADSQPEITVPEGMTLS